MVVDISNSVPMDLAHDTDSAMIDLTGSPLDIGQELFMAELLPEPPTMATFPSTPVSTKGLQPPLSTGSFTVDESLFNPWKLG